MKEKEMLLYMDWAKRVAQCSSATRLKVGAVIARSGGLVVAYGWNGTPNGFSNECELNNVTKPEVVHAEMNAIMKAAREGRSCEGAWLFITHLPCDLCVKHIVQSGVKFVVYDEVYKSSSGNNRTGFEMLERGGVRCMTTKEALEFVDYNQRLTVGVAIAH